MEKQRLKNIRIFVILLEIFDALTATFQSTCFDFFACHENKLLTHSQGFSRFYDHCLFWEKLKEFDSYPFLCQLLILKSIPLLFIQWLPSAFIPSLVSIFFIFFYEFLFAKSFFGHLHRKRSNLRHSSPKTKFPGQKVIVGLMNYSSGTFRLRSLVFDLRDRVLIPCQKKSIFPWTSSSLFVPTSGLR